MKNLLIALIFCLITFVFPNAGNADGLTKIAPNSISAAEIVTSSNRLSADEPFWLALHLKLEKGWHTYWQNPGDSGLPPQLKWTLPKGFSSQATHFPTPERVDVAGLANFGYHGDAWLLTPITPPKDFDATSQAPLTFNLSAEWLVCKDICIPETANFTITINEQTPINAELNKIIKTLPQFFPAANNAEQANYQVNEDKITLHLPLPPETTIFNKNKGRKDFFPLEGGLVSNHAPQKIEYKNNELILTLKANNQAKANKLTGLLTIEANKQTPAKSFFISANLTPTTAPNLTLKMALFFAFLGGLILNFMPCVLPILSLKIISISQYNSKGESIKHGLTYSAGVLSCFAILASILIIIQKSGQEIGWGFQLQSPAFVTALSCLFYLMALNLYGVFSLPVLLGNVGQEITRKKGLISSFLTGLLAVLIATPCSAPFMAPAVGFALTQDTGASLAIFTSLGLGLAAPYLLISFFPAIGKIFPKPGKWMEKLKKFLALPLFATTLWLIWILWNQCGKTAAIGIIILLPFLHLLVWRAEKSLRPRLWLAATIGLIIIGVIGVQFAFAWERYCVFVPKATEQAFSQKTLDELRRQQKAVLVDATADWCITCKVNEIVSLSSDKVQKHFANRNITILRADWTHKDDAITRYLQSFGYRGVPLYVYYPEKGAPIILPQILTPNIIIKATQ